MAEFEVLNWSTTFNNDWFNAVVVSSGDGNFLVYINGVLQGTLSDSYNPTSGNGSLILRKDTNINWAQTALYDRALTASEVLQNFNALKSRYGY